MNGIGLATEAIADKLTCMKSEDLGALMTRTSDLLRTGNREDKAMAAILRVQVICELSNRNREDA